MNDLEDLLLRWSCIDKLYILLLLFPKSVTWIFYVRMLLGGAGGGVLSDISRDWKWVNVRTYRLSSDEPHDLEERDDFTIYMHCRSESR